MDIVVILRTKATFVYIFNCSLDNVATVIVLKLMVLTYSKVTPSHHHRHQRAQGFQPLPLVISGLPLYSTPEQYLPSTAKILLHHLVLQGYLLPQHSFLFLLYFGPHTAVLRAYSWFCHGTIHSAGWAGELLPWFHQVQSECPSPCTVTPASPRQVPYTRSYHSSLPRVVCCLFLL